jgi:hypothetical protein
VSGDAADQAAWLGLLQRAGKIDEQRLIAAAHLGAARAAIAAWIGVDLDRG